MTTEQLSQLTPEQKRVKCAELMGYKKHDCNGPTCWCIHNGEDGMIRTGDFNQLVPNFPVDANAALTLCDRMAEEGWNAELNNGLDKTWECAFSHSELTKARAGGREPVMHYGCANTLPEAIVSAFLLVKG